MDRRRGKALRAATVIVEDEKCGMQGRLLLIQEHPFECHTNYTATGVLRCNFDVQDLRRVLPKKALRPRVPEEGDEEMEAEQT